MTFRVGQKVVCIRARLVSVVDDRPDVVIGKIYTIRAVRGGYRKHLGDSLLLEEISSPIHEETGDEMGFYSARFRPVASRKTDISIFIQMLKPSKVRA